MIGSVEDFIWNSQMYVENEETAWFVGSDINVLFRVDLKNETYTYITDFPNSKLKSFRESSLCYKVGNFIFCFPDIGDKIWVFDEDKNKFNILKIKKPDSCRIGIMKIIQRENSLFAVSVGLKGIIEINLVNQKISNYYFLMDNTSNDKLGWECAEIESCVYCITNTSNRVYEFNFDTKVVKEYIIPELSEGIATICGDGDSIWLSGYKKEICIWNRRTGQREIITKFPQEFGVYKMGDSFQLLIDCETDIYDMPLFINSCIMRDKVWYIPFQSNYIIYVDIISKKISIVDIPNEEETLKSWSRGMKYRYILEYILNDRYIGIYSFKNKKIFEIDTKLKKIVDKRYILDNEGLKKLWKQLFNIKEFILNESSPLDLVKLIEIYKLNKLHDTNRKETIGEKIFHS